MPDPEQPVIKKMTDPPPGLLPKNAQSLALGGLALVMVLLIVFSSRQGAKSPKAAISASPSTQTPERERIQEYQERIDEQVKRLPAEQIELAQKQQTLNTVTAVPSNGARPTAFVSGVGQATWARPYSSSEPDPMETERQKREYDSLFASSIALSKRKKDDSSTLNQTRVDPSGMPTASEAMTAVAPQPRNESTEAARSSTANANPGESSTQPSKMKKGPADSFSGAERQYRIREGTVLETVLTNRLEGAFTGPVNCMVTANVYSSNGLHLLIPQGARVLGEAKRIESFGQQRLAVTFHRLLLPDETSVDLDRLSGLDQIGATGLLDKVNHHYLQTFGVSLAIGAIAGLGQASTRYGSNPSAGDIYVQGVSTSLSQSSMQILDRYLNVLPTFTVREGKRVKIYLSGDLLLPESGTHLLKNDGGVR